MNGKGKESRVKEALFSQKSSNSSETQIRDVNDRPILRAAIHANVDILLTGDKDFLESGIKTPLILTPAEFLKI